MSTSIASLLIPIVGVVVVVVSSGTLALQPKEPIDDAHLPGFFLVGGQKCGTSSMWSYLKGHPQFVPPKRKETFILNSNRGEQSCLSSDSSFEARKEINGSLWNFWNDWMKLSDTSGLITGDFSTTYMSCGCCMTSIKILNPNAKIIAILRDPASRSRSRYQEQKFLQENVWRKQIKKRGLTSLEEIAEKDDVLIRKCLLKAHDSKHKGPNVAVAAMKCIRHYSVIGWSKYELFLPHIFSTFSRSNILILYTEDMSRNATNELLKVESFLGIREWVPKNINTQYNINGKWGWNVPNTARHGTLKPAKPPSKQDQQSDYPDDVIGPSLCKALEKTYASMPEYVEKGWLSPLPSEWKCQPQQ